MGLEIGVGLRARNFRELDAEQFEEFDEDYRNLSAVLQEAGIQKFQEPTDLEEDIFEAQMWGYSGLHTVRRLAAYIAMEQRLPLPWADDGEASKDDVLENLYNAHNVYWNKKQKIKSKESIIKRILFPDQSTILKKPKFQHLLWHSDAEGFYVPIMFDDVILDNAEPQRPGVGGMVGSSYKLLEECTEIAKWIELPENTDPEAEELFKAIDERNSEGPMWRSYPVEAFCLARLIRGCQLSLQYKAALRFC